jgi:hypothetical protein
MAELGPAADLAAVAEYPDDGGWGLLIDDETIVDVEIDQTNAVLVMSAEVCVLPQPRADHWCRLMLNANDQWRDTGGFRLGLSAVDGMVSQSLVLTADGLDLAALQERLARFLEVLSAWRAMLTREPGPTEQETASHPHPGGMIRG